MLRKHKPCKLQRIQTGRNNTTTTHSTETLFFMTWGSVFKLFGPICCWSSLRKFRLFAVPFQRELDNKARGGRHSLQASSMKIILMHPLSRGAELGSFYSHASPLGDLRAEVLISPSPVAVPTTTAARSHATITPQRARPALGQRREMCFKSFFLFLDPS